MKISNGNWLIQPNLDVLYTVRFFDIDIADNQITVYVAPKSDISRDGQLDTPLFTLTLSSPMPGILGVRLAHFTGQLPRAPRYTLQSTPTSLHVTRTDTELRIQTGDLSAIIATGDHFAIEFYHGQTRLTGSATQGSGYVTHQHTDQHQLFQRLDLGVGENVYGLGERFTAFVKNGQTVDIWNQDGGTSSEQAYKNIPFYLTNRGYGVYVDHPGKVSFEVASEKVSKVQFSVTDETLDYYIIDGPTPKQVLDRYTHLTGRPALPPAWSFGLWLTTSFTTNYDEKTVNSFIQGMADRQIPLHVFHFDCFWMKAFQWCDFTWDPETFPDPQGMIQRLKQRGLHLCVWINPYIGQKSPLFAEGMQKGFLLHRPNGDVWQWDKWQPGQAIVDFTNPDACRWYTGFLDHLMEMGIDCFKTDFGERIPTDVHWFDGSDPERMHNYYAYLYNQVVFSAIQAKRGHDDAVVFARSAAVGSQKFPVHWGGDCNATYESMAESLRGGLSLGLSGFGFWSHDIGGFENTAPADVYKRWCAFGLLSSHSRLHGSKSYRVPWLFDDEACDVLRFFTQWKCRLMPYLFQQAQTAASHGTPLMRAMVLEFPDDPACDALDRQYMLGERLLVAPVFNAEGRVDFYLPDGNWTHLFNNRHVTGGRWLHEEHSFMSLPLYVRDNTLLALGQSTTETAYDFADHVCAHLFDLQDGHTATTAIPDLQGQIALHLHAHRQGHRLTIQAEYPTRTPQPWQLCLRHITLIRGASPLQNQELTPDGLLLTPELNTTVLTIELE